MSHLPHSVRVDRNVKDDYYKNFDAYNMKGLNQADDYVCVFENNGQLIPDLGLGLNFRMANSKQTRKDVCENKFRGGKSEPGMYIRKSDWISAKGDYLQCAAYNSKDDTRATYQPNGDPRFLPSKQLCDKYKNKGDFDIYTKMIPREDDRATVDLRKEKVDIEDVRDSKGKIIWTTYYIVVFVYLFWTFKFNTKKPYDFYDLINNTFVNKFMYIIVIFGVFLYLYCPFDTCFHSFDTPLYRKNLPLVIKRDFCSYLNENTTKLEYPICNKYDNSKFYKMLTPVINMIFKFNRMLTSPLKNLYSNMCTPCDLDHKCIDRSPKYTLAIKTPPLIITEYENSLNKILGKTVMTITDYLNAINTKYKTTEANVPYDTGTIIRLKTNDKTDPNNNTLFMAAVIMMPTNYQYKWILLKKRSGNMTYDGEDKNLKLKYCVNSYRILSVDNNYELLGYSYALDVNSFMTFFEKNDFSYKRFFFFPNFDLAALKNDRFFQMKPKFIKRKLLQIYKYLTSHPTKKFITPNVSIVAGEYVKYQINDANSKNYINNTDKFIDEISDIMDYHNDDEEDIDYLEYYEYYKELQPLNYKLREIYRIDLIKDKIKKYHEDRLKNDSVNKILNMKLPENEKIINKHDLVPYKFEDKGVIYRCRICKQECLIK